MYIIQCVKPGISHDTNVKQGYCLAHEFCRFEFTRQLDLMMKFKSKEEAQSHIELYLHMPFNTALFYPYSIEKISWIGRGYTPA